jgi:hypothetical protein
MYSADRIAQEAMNLLLGDIAPALPGERVKQWVDRAAEATGLAPGYVKKLRYREVPAVPAHVMDQLRDLAARQRAAKNRIAAARKQNAELLDFLLVSQRGLPAAVFLPAQPVAAAASQQRLPGRGGLVGEDGGMAHEPGAAVDDPRQIPLPLTGWRR